MRLSQEPRSLDVLLMSFGTADASGTSSACSSVVRFLLLWAISPFEDLQDPVVRTCTLRKWNPRPACGTAFSSVHHILSVCPL